MAFNGTGSNVTSLNASNISSGTVGTARLASGTANSTTFLRGDQTWSEGGGDYIMRTYTGPATWTKPTGLKAVKVTVVGGGGNGGASPAPGAKVAAGSGGGGGAAIRYLDAPAIPGPVAISSGGAGATSSFGAFASATGGAAGGVAPTQPGYATPGTGGTGSSGDLNMPGGAGQFPSVQDASTSEPTTYRVFSGEGGSSIMGQGGGQQVNQRTAGLAGSNYGGGGSGAGLSFRSSKSPFPALSGGAGGSGVVIVEEFY